MRNPHISIIIPVYNVEKYLSRCLDSILSQTVHEWELLLVDDGSKDNSGRICDDYASKDDRIIVIHKQNGGVSSARNVGLREAKGYWIAFIDADDWVDNNFLEPIKDVKPDIELIHQGKTIEYPIGGSREDPIRRPGEFETKTIFSTSKWSSFCWSFFFKRDVIVKNQLSFNETLSFSEDRLFIMQYAVLTSKMCFIEASPYHYYMNTNSVCRSVRDPQTFYNDLLVIKSFIDYLFVNSIKTDYESLKFILHISINGMKSDLAPYYAEINVDQFVSELISCKEFVQGHYGERFNDFFDPLIKWPRMTLIKTLLKSKMYIAISRLMRGILVFF